LDENLIDDALIGDAMAGPRKIFRIEEMVASRLSEHGNEAHAPLHHAELMQEIAALRATVAAMAPRPTNDSGVPRNGTAARLTSELNLIAGAIGGGVIDGAGLAKPAASGAPMTRAAHELEEVVGSTERATQRVLAAAEQIDQLANNLAAALQGKYEQGLAKDIQDLVVKIFEACNFQDLAGQRVAKVLAALNFVEDHVTRAIEEMKNPSVAVRRDGNQYLHGPRLDSDNGHVSQADIDAMFTGNN
jgi:chemotaxis protein CheZ